MKFCSLYSGSSGNSLFVSCFGTSLLVDAGKNGKQIEKQLFEIGEDPHDLNGILITHEHSDHIAGAGVLSRRYHIPVYANFNTWEEIGDRIGKIAPENRIVFENRIPFTLGEMQCLAFKTSHDAADSVGFRLTDGRSRICIATDTGCVTDDLRENLPGSDLIYLESNHDIGMLETGAYPFYLKQRIKGARGHLSNDDAAAFAAELVRYGTDKLILAHLSSENNLPMLAHQTAVRVFAENEIVPGKDVSLEVAPRNMPGQIHLL